MADVMKGPEPDDGIKTTDLTSEKPSAYVGSPWRKEPAQIIVRGRAAGMLASVLSMLVILAVLRFVFEANFYFALVVAILVPWLYQDVGREVSGKIGLALKLWWNRRQQR